MTRESAIAHLAHKIIGCKAFGESKADGVNLVALEMALEALEQPERKKGKWIESIRRVGTKFHPDCPDFYSVFVCTACLKANDRTEKYCPNCGAEMEE